jgi:thymidylate synthase
MFIAEDTLDDLLRSVFENLFKNGSRVQASKGWNTELSGVLLEIRNPRARLSRTETKGTVFSCLGETLWYLAKTNRLDFIKYYLPDYGEFSDDNKTVYGAYGPRLFKMRGRINQLSTIIGHLKKKPSTRQAVIQLFNAEDLLEPHNDIPCTCILQFFVRRNKLHMMTYMRSNDAFLGLPHDVFAFTLLQEIVARSIGVNLGTYKHSIGSLHLYDKHLSKAKRFLKEGWQSRITMPAMPPGNPWPNIEKLLSIEFQLRTSQKTASVKPAIPDYWADLVRLLQIYASDKNKKQITAIKRQMKSQVYDAYIDKRIARGARR